MRRRRKVFLSLVLVAGSFVVIGFGCADRLIMGTSRDVLHPAGVREATLQVEGRRMEYWVAHSPGADGREPAAVVLFFVGKADQTERWITMVAEAWGDLPVEVWGLNYPGSGGSEGPPSLARVGPWSLALYDEARKSAGTRPIFIQAASFGTTAALCVAARRPVAGLILQNPPPLRQLILGQYGWWNLWLGAWPVASQVPPELDSLANGARVTAPAIFLLAENDEVVAPRFQKRVVAAYAGPKTVINIPGSRHNQPLPHEASVQLKKSREQMWEREMTLRK